MHQFFFLLITFKLLSGRRTGKWRNLRKSSKENKRKISLKIRVYIVDVNKKKVKKCLQNSLRWRQIENERKEKQVKEDEYVEEEWGKRGKVIWTLKVTVKKSAMIIMKFRSKLRKWHRRKKIRKTKKRCKKNRTDSMKKKTENVKEKNAMIWKKNEI